VHIRSRKLWELPERLATSEDHYMNRRTFLKAASVGSAALMASSVSGEDPDSGASLRNAVRTMYPADRNPAYKVHLPMSEESVAAQFNNFYEFSAIKEKVHELVDGFDTHPWSIEVGGHCNNPGTFDVDNLTRKFGLEERVYRFRCVEAWAMVVPWTGFPLSKLIDLADPTSKAKYVRMFTFNRPEQAPGQKKQSWYPWPYFEAISVEEARNELSLMATGIYGHEMPMQHGAPIRLVVPWKYGYKSIKSVVKIEFTSRRPDTFWNTLAPREYGFVSNVNPAEPHPRWSQATEQMIGTGKRVQTLKYNGYRKQVGHLYG
jgi:methionine sulfoxide reductase catalytic subunit